MYGDKFIIVIGNNNPELNKKVQDKLFNCNYKWSNGKKEYIALESGVIWVEDMGLTHSSVYYLEALYGDEKLDGFEIVQAYEFLGQEIIGGELI